LNADPNKQREEHAPQSDLNALLPLMQMRNMVGYLYGSEDISLLFYALIRREKPQNLIELGTGVGVTALWMAQACKENGSGKVWTIDDGSQWQDVAHFRTAMMPLSTVPPFNQIDFNTVTYVEFMQQAIQLLDLGPHLEFMPVHLELDSGLKLDPDKYPFMRTPWDFLFLDINRMPDHILDILHQFLPRMGPWGSIFIDSASTSAVSFLFLENLVTQLNAGKVPRRFLNEPDAEWRRQLFDAVAAHRFTLMHLVERLQREQNSTAWLKIEPNDYVPHPDALMKWV
jgi:hypothetical protein